MVTRRTALALTVTLAASGLALHAGCRGPATLPAAAEFGGVALESSAGHSSGAPATAPTPATAAGGAERLDAVRTVMVFCDLVDSGRRWRARSLCSTPDAWWGREARALTRFTFLSARIVEASDPGELSVLARVHVHSSRDQPLEDAALHEGINTLLFTLGRVGTTTGGWLIAAVKTSPQTQERGPS